MPEPARPPVIQRGKVVTAPRRRIADDREAARHVVARFAVVEGRVGSPGDVTPNPVLRPGCCVAICTRGRATSVVRFLDSLHAQEMRPEQLIIVDSSRDDATEQALRAHPRLAELARRVDYFRVAGPLVGLTPQRNQALRWVTTELVVFFDDDIVLLPGCLAALERTHRQTDDVIGVGALIENERDQPTTLWRVRRFFHIVPTLQPGAYTRSGFQIPWRFLPLSDAVVDGDWLQGCAMMWRTADARSIGYHEGLDGYASGEDLEFSLQMRARGRIVVAGSARLLHLHDWNSRPDPVQMGFMGLRNLFYIHNACLPGRRRRDVAYFLYGYGMDTIVRTLALIKPGSVRVRWQFLWGRLRCFRQLLWPVS